MLYLRIVQQAKTKAKSSYGLLELCPKLRFSCVKANIFTFHFKNDQWYISSASSLHAHNESI